MTTTTAEKSRVDTAPPRLNRTTLTTSRLLDFCSERELVAQVGHQIEYWPVVVLKELLDNALDACDDARVAPEITVVVNDDGLIVRDNGPGIPTKTIKSLLDFSVRVSNREAYMAPDRGAQGNALKTIIAMPFVLSGWSDEHWYDDDDRQLEEHQRGHLSITARGIRHDIDIAVDQLRQKPRITHDKSKGLVRNGTEIRMEWPDSARCLLDGSEGDFLQIAEGFAFLNPHLTLKVDWFGKVKQHFKATTPDWQKWRPSDPTSPHWYEPEHLARLIAGYIGHDIDKRRDRTVREFVSEFRGLSSTAKQKKVLEITGTARTNLSAFVNGGGAVDTNAVASLLSAMRQHSKPVKPKALGVIGEDHLKERFGGLGCEMESFNYRKVAKVGKDGLPVVIETAFAWRGDQDDEGEDYGRRLLVGVNWSAAIGDPFRELGETGQSLSSVLADRYANTDEPIVFLLHVACPRVEYTDRGKSAVVVKD